MKKIILSTILVILVVFSPLVSGAENGPAFHDLSGYLVSLDKTPPTIKLATGSGEKKFHWILGKTGFFGHEGQEIEASVFLRRFKHSSVTLVFEGKIVVNVFATRF